MERQVSGAARDRALPEPRRRSLRPPPRRPALDPGDGGPLRRRPERMGGGDRPGRARDGALPDHGGRLPVRREPAGHSGARAIRGRVVPHGALAEGGGRLPGQARGTHRDRLHRHPGHAADRCRSPSPHGLPAHAELHGPGAPRGVSAAATGRDQEELQADLRAHPRVACRLPVLPDRPQDDRRLARRASADPRRPVGRGRLQVPVGRLHRPADRSGRERGRVGVHPRQDPRDRRRSGDRRAALPHGPSLRREATAHRHRLLRDLQPGQRDPGRPQALADRGDHEGGRCGPGMRSTSSTPSSSPPASTR